MCKKEYPRVLSQLETYPEDFIDASGFQTKDVSKVYIISQVLRHSKAIARLIFSHKLSELACRILATEKAIYHFSNITIKSSQIKPSFNWHCDFPNQFICNFKPDFLRFVIALDAMTFENGAIGYLPQSHTFASCKRSQYIDQPKEKSTDFKGKQIVCSETDLVVLHPLLIHSGGISTCKELRRNIIIQIGPANGNFATKNKEYLTGKLFEPGEVNDDRLPEQLQ